MRKSLMGSLLLSTALFAQPQGDLENLRNELEVIKEELRKLKLEISAPEIREYRSYSGLGPAASKALINPKGVSVGDTESFTLSTIRTGSPKMR